MSEKMNACVIANGKAMGFPALFGIARIKEETPKIRNYHPIHD